MSFLTSSIHTSLVVNPSVLKTPEKAASSVAVIRSSSRSSACKRTTTIKVFAAGGFGEKKGPPKGKPLSKFKVEQNLKGDKFDEMAKDGKPVYAVFVRVAGPNQWFPVGPMAVDNESSIVSNIFAAEKDLVSAALRMYPAMISKRKDPGLEYGYRLRDAPQMSEEDIKKGGNPFENVVVATRKEAGVAEPESTGGFFSGLKEAMNNFERNFTSGRE